MVLKIARSSKKQPNLKLLCRLRAEVQYFFCAPGPDYVISQSPFANCMEKRKDADEIGFSRAIRTDQNVDRFQRKLLKRRDALEATNRDVVKRTRRHVSLRAEVKAAPGDPNFPTD